MKRRTTFVVSILAALMSCSSPKPSTTGLGFVEQLSQSGKVQLTGWMRVSGEALIYETQDRMQSRAKYPYCVSGVFERHDPSKIAPYDGLRVIVVGTLFEFDSLKDDDSPVIPRKMLGGSVIANFCDGSKVLLMETVQVAK